MSDFKERPLEAETVIWTARRPMLCGLSYGVPEQLACRRDIAEEPRELSANAIFEPFNRIRINQSTGHAASGRPAEQLLRHLGLPQGEDRILRHLNGMPPRLLAALFIWPASMIGVGCAELARALSG